MRNLSLVIAILWSYYLGSQNINLVPYPTSVSIQNDQIPLTIRPDFSIRITGQGSRSNRLKQGSQRFLRLLDQHTGIHFKQEIPNGHNLEKDTHHELTIEVKKEVKLGIEVDESYSLDIHSKQITFHANTDIGALRGLETLLQLPQVNMDGYYFPSVNISDQPQYKWRGLLLDAARHFISPEAIKRQLDLMAMFKLNVLHLHLADDQAWRIEIKAFPKLHQHSANNQYYTQAQISDIVTYADQLGIRIYPSLGLPTHSSALLSAMPQLASLHYQYRKDKDTQRPLKYYTEKHPGTFDAAIDPTNQETYRVLNKIFGELAYMFPDPVVHIGGNINGGYQWTHSDLIQAFMKNNKMKSVSDLQQLFVQRLARIIKSNKKQLMGWDNIPAIEKQKGTFIHAIHSRHNLYKAAQSGHPTILSYGYELDKLHPLSYYSANTIVPKTKTLSKKAKINIYGGEAILWTDYVVRHNLDQRLWPRTGAIAEKFWSKSSTNNIASRLASLDNLLELRGSTHLTQTNRILRNLANGQDPAPIMTLYNLTRPVLPNNPALARTYYGYTHLGDILSTEPIDAQTFTQWSQLYLQGQAEATTRLKEFGQQWVANHPKFQSLLATSPELTEFAPMSEKLALLGKILLRILRYDDSFNIDELDNLNTQLNSTEQIHANAQLAVVSALRAMLMSKRPALQLEENSDIDIDGNLQEWKNLSTFYPILTQETTSHTSYALAHDGDDLFIGLKVKDSLLTNRAHTAMGIRSDGIHIKVIGNEDQTPLDFHIYMDKTIKVTQGDKSDIDYSLKKTDQGYTLEIEVELDQINQSRLIIGVEHLSDDAKQTLESYTPNHTTVKLDKGLLLQTK